MVIDYGKLIFGNVDSSEYGIYVSGEGVYNAPQRAVEFVKVPGRNGDIAMDQGRFENITVTYPAMYIGEDQEEFREKLMEYRNAIMSQKGYQKLEDTYHPEEYRMGVYADGLEVDSVFTYQIGGEFKLKFNCKPQRWLTVGALPIPVDSGDVLQNPTPFDSGPLLEITGYGTIGFNGYEVELDNAVLGETLLLDYFYDPGISGGVSISNTVTKDIDKALFNTGDTITVYPCIFRSGFYTNAIPHTKDSATATGSNVGGYGLTEIGSSSDNTEINIYMDAMDFAAGTSSNYAYQLVISFKHLTNNTHLGTLQLNVKVSYIYDSLDEKHYIKFEFSAQATDGVYKPQGVKTFAGDTYVDSTLSILGNPTYIDCDLGEAYRIENGVPVSLNSKVALGSDLPNLAPGMNKITFDNTITDLKIAPRWWRV